MYEMGDGSSQGMFVPCLGEHFLGRRRHYIKSKDHDTPGERRTTFTGWDITAYGKHIVPPSYSNERQYSSSPFFCM
jgi:hypothetical protein